MRVTRTCAGLLAASIWMTTALAQQPSGTISGTVTADRGDVRGLRVKARDTAHRISYVVFTNKGRYQIANLPRASYEVQVLEADFMSTPQTVDLKGPSATANLTIKAKAPMAAQGAGAAAAAGQEGYRGASSPPVNASGEAVELVDFDTLYPPSHARDVMLRECFGCHGLGL